MSLQETPLDRSSGGPPSPAAVVDTKPPARNLGLALLVIAAAQLMLVLDGTIVTVALPSMKDSLGMAEADLNWVLTAYALSFGGLLLAGGRAGDLFGRRRVFRIGLVLFTAASLLGGLATGGAMLLTARVLQGAGAALAAPTALSLLATTFPAGPARNKAIGVYGAMGGLGSVVGLLLGGALTEGLSWRWVFFVNVPIAVLVLAGTGVLVEGGRERGKVDVSGALSATFGLAALVYGINRGGTDGWTDSVALTALAISVVLLAAFVAIQRASRTPMMPGRVVADRGRVGANIVLLLMGGGMMATFYFLTLYMQVIKGYEPMRTGLAYLPFALGIGIAAGGLGPALLGRVSERALTMWGMAIAAVGMAWFTMLTPGQNPWAALLPAQLVAGVGLGLAFVTTTIAGVRGVAEADTGIASGLINTSQQIGGAIGLATLAALATSVTEDKLPGNVAEALTDGYAVGIAAGGALYVAAIVVAALTMNRTVQKSAS